MGTTLLNIHLFEENGACAELEPVKKGVLTLHLFKLAGRHTPERCLIVMQCYVALSFLNFILRKRSLIFGFLMTFFFLIVMAFGVIRLVEQRPPLPNGIAQRPVVPPVPLMIQVGGGGGGGGGRV